jgi:hypothetical protein
VDDDSTIGRRLTPQEVDALRQITWRDTELGDFEEEAVIDLGKHTI